MNENSKLRSKSYLGIVASVASLVLLTSVAQAQTPPAGFFTFVNAVGTSENLIVSVDGRPIRPDGIKPGAVTGALGFIAGSHQISVSQKESKPATLSLQLSPTTSPIIIAYVVEVQGPTGQKSRELRLFARPNSPESQAKIYTALYAGQGASVSVQVSGQPVTLKPLQEAVMPSSGSITANRNATAVSEFGSEEPGHYLIVLFDAKPVGALNAVTVTDRIYTRAGAKASGR